ncbi:hypothetical protein Hanom_Chr16g01429351 [Helianthus anomalus]
MKSRGPTLLTEREKQWILQWHIRRVELAYPLSGTILFMKNNVIRASVRVITMYNSTQCTRSRRVISSVWDIVIKTNTKVWSTFYIA